ncbi:MAG TPA: GNAT family N-acetyltransferase [Bauldia sp.]|nr:GNAT family N-acetyltransferase [Bauldia sp.]
MQDRRDGESEGEYDRAAPIRTPRLLMRRPSEQDHALIARFVANPGMARNLAVAPGGEDEGESFAIVERRSATVVGVSGYGPMTDRPGAIEVATWIGEAFWGRGYATEATHAVIDRAFCETGISILWCNNRVSNARARRVIEKCGFQFHETGMGRSPGSFGAIPVERFVLERRNWASLKSWGAGSLEESDVRRDNAA